MRKTMRKVTTVVPVLMTSCQVSLKLKMGPVTAQVTTTAVARKKMAGFPQKSEAWRAKRPNHPACWDTRIFAGGRRPVLAILPLTALAKANEPWKKGEPPKETSAAARAKENECLLLPAWPRGG